MSNVAAWPTFMAKLRNRQGVAERTMSFSFEKLADWTFRAGQFIDITLLNPAETDAEGNTRGFSVSSAPYEEAITITTRMRDTAFKRILGGMALDTEVKIEGPFGDLRLPLWARSSTSRGRRRWCTAYELCTTSGIDEDDIRSEEFTGY
jgi:ferredoxin-NADP reductase